MDRIELGNTYPPVIALGEKREVGRIMIGATQVWPKLFTKGKLYNAAALTNLANTGWHVPSSLEFVTMGNYLFNAYNTTSIHLGEYWNIVTPRKNIGGFSAIPTGVISNTGVFSQITELTIFWTTTPSGVNQIGIHTTYNFVANGGALSNRNVKEGCTVRLVKNDSNYVPFYIDNVGNKYRTAKIGNQIWMIDNLKDTKLNTGVNIPIITNSAAWFNTSGAMCASPNYNSANE